MKIKTLASVTALSALLAACGGGDITIDARSNSVVNEGDVDNSIGDGNIITEGGSNGGPTNICASYTRGALLVQGTVQGSNCFYGTDFVDLTAPLELAPTSPVTFRDLPNDGAHVFGGSLVVGRSYNSNADMQAAGITEGGDGTVIRIEAGATLAFQTAEDYMVINRGSQIFAEGTASAPITITSVSDLNGTVDPEDVQQWGGMIINGFGVTNKCAYTGTRGVDLALAGECHVAAEGKAGAAQTFYGGDNDADNSGILNYFIVKHTGAQVEEGNELNGIAFDAVGSGTEVDYIQAYSTFDDGVEMFGGAVDVGHYIGLYVRDDSIDIDEGYIGTFDYALVIQSETDGNRCVESDGIGSYSSQSQATIDDFIARGLNSAATIRNLTCIVSATEHAEVDPVLGTGTHDPGQGMRIREAHFPTIENALITTAYGADIKLGDDDYNYCVRIDNEGGQAALDGNLTMSQSVVACQDLIDGDLNGSSTLDWLNLTNFTYQSAEAGDDPTATSNGDLVILDGFYSVALSDMRVGNAATAPAITPTQGRTYIGAVTAGDDWTAGWAYGLETTNRGQALWFE